MAPSLPSLIQLALTGWTGRMHTSKASESADNPTLASKLSWLYPALEGLRPAFLTSTPGSKCPQGCYHEKALRSGAATPDARMCHERLLPLITPQKGWETTGVLPLPLQGGAQALQGSLVRGA